MLSGYAVHVVFAIYLFILQNDFCTLSQFLYRFITFPTADTPTPSPLTTDSGFFSPESTASSPRGTSVIRASLRELTLIGYSYVHTTVTPALVPSVEVCNNYYGLQAVITLIFSNCRPTYKLIFTFYFTLYVCQVNLDNNDLPHSLCRWRA